MCHAIHVYILMPQWVIASAASVSCELLWRHGHRCWTRRYLGEVGSTRLPLRSIAENTIGQKLSYEAVNQENELPPLFAAIRSNTSIKVMSVHSMKGKDILSVRHSCATA